jgi:hypothetical protein
MKFEGVGSISVRYLRLEIGWQIDNCNGFKGTSMKEGYIPQIAEESHDILFDADTATNTQKLGDECYLIGGLHLNTKFA